MVDSAGPGAGEIGFDGWLFGRVVEDSPDPLVVIGQQDAAVRCDIYIDKSEIDPATLVIFRSPLGLGEDGHLGLPGRSIPVHLKGAEPSGVVVTTGGG